MDLLSTTLLRLQPRGARYFASEMAAPWGFAAPAGVASYHVVLRGRCELVVDDPGPGGPATSDTHTVVLEAGDVAVTPTGAACRFRSDADALTPPLSALAAQIGDDGVLRSPGRGPVTELVCGTIDFDLAVPHPLLEGLPPVLTMREGGVCGPGAYAGDGAPADSPGSGMARSGSPVRHLIDAIAREARCSRPGATAAMSYLACVLFVRVVRDYVHHGTVDGPSLVRGLQDPYVAPALDAVHADPAHDWTIAAMADTAGLSRSAFADRFTRAVGTPPIEYVTRWRMREAARLLRTTHATLADVADRVGYGSAAAFGRRFKEEVGQPPGAFRNRVDA